MKSKHLNICPISVLAASRPTRKNRPFIKKKNNKKKQEIKTKWNNVYRVYWCVYGPELACVAWYEYDPEGVPTEEEIKETEKKITWENNRDTNRGLSYPDNRQPSKLLLNNAGNA